MSIRKRQVKSAKEKALKDLLKKGELPDTRAVEFQVNKILKGIRRGEPSFVFEPVRPNDLSNARSFNETLYSIKEDLTVAFDEALSLSEGIENTVGSYELNRNLVELNMKKTERRIERLIERLNNPFSHNVLTENFHTFRSIDFKGNERVGVQKTCAHIDLESGEVKLPTYDAMTKRYELSDVAYEVNIPKGVGSEIEPFRYALGGQREGSWKYQVKKESVEETVAEVNLTLHEEVSANELSFYARTPKQTYAALYLKSSEGDWKSIGKQLIYGKTEWQFDEEVKEIKIKLSKEEPDYSGGGEVTYYFSMKNLSLRHSTYQEEAFFVSKPIEIEASVLDKIKLSAKDIIYPGTEIQYYVGIDDPDFVEWQEVVNGKSAKMNQLGVMSERITSGSTGYGEVVNENYGVTYHEIGELSKIPLSGERRIRLYEGDYMWKVETKYVDDLDITYLPTLKDWVGIRDIETGFLPIEETLQGKTTNLTPKTLQRFTTHVYSLRDEEVYNIELVKGDAMAQVYVNNTPIKGNVNNLYTYRLVKGWNRIEILTYAGKEEPFAPNLYFRDIASAVVANNEPLKQVSAYQLYHNVAKHDMRYFTYVDGKLVINYNPTEKVLEGDGVSYLVEYDYIPEDAEEVRHIRFMAHMKRNKDKSEMSPVIRSYKLILE